MVVWPEMQQQSDQWFAARAGRPTASRFRDIITPEGKDSKSWEKLALELLAESIHPTEFQGFAGNHDTDRGNELEDVARQYYEEQTGYKVTQTGLITRDDGVVGFSPDGLILSDDKPLAKNGSNIAHGLEIKCPRRKQHAETLIKQEMPAEHNPQVHGSMACAGLKRWDFVSYNSGFKKQFITQIKWDSYTDKVADALDRFLIFYADFRAKNLHLLIDA